MESPLKCLLNIIFIRERVLIKINKSIPISAMVLIFQNGILILIYGIKM